jgi:hypothetical protein
VTVAGPPTGEPTVNFRAAGLGVVATITAIGNLLCSAPDATRGKP